MRSTFLFLICGLFIGGCQTTGGLPTSNKGQWKGSPSFVEGTVEITDLKTMGEGDLIRWSEFEVHKKYIWSNLIHDDALIGMEIRMTEEGPIVRYYNEYVSGNKSSFKQVGRDLHVKTLIFHYYGVTNFAYTLKGVFADDAPVPMAAQPISNTLKATPQPSSIADRFKQLDNLLKQQLISQEEYDRLRKKILKEL